jgi:hypothetical protein
VLDNQFAHPVQLVRAKTIRIRQFYRVQPVFSGFTRMRDMDVRRLAGFKAVEKEPEAQNSEDCRHRGELRPAQPAGGGEDTAGSGSSLATAKTLQTGSSPSFIASAGTAASKVARKRT